MIILAVCFTHTAFSFSPEDSIRNRYIESFPDKFYIKPIYTIRNLKMDISSRNNNIGVTYKPNGNTYFGLGIYIFNLGIETSFKLPKSGENLNIYGETEIFDIQSNIYAEKWGADIAIQQYEGFYLSNPREHNKNWDSDGPYPQRPDLSINQVLLHAFYLVNHERFSYRSAYNIADRQRKSGGSLLVGVNFQNQQIIADTSLIPGESQAMFRIEDFEHSRLSSLGALGGYTHSFIKNYFYVNLSLAGGPALLWSKYREDELERSKTQIAPVLNMRAALGYNTPTWFGGLTVVSQQSNLLTEHLDIDVETGNIKIFFGYRFKEIGILKKDLRPPVPVTL